MYNYNINTIEKLEAELEHFEAGMGSVASLETLALEVFESIADGSPDAEAMASMMATAMYTLPVAV